MHALKNDTHVYYYTKQTFLINMLYNHFFCQMWLENPKQQLIAKEAFRRIEAPWNSDEGLVTR